MKFSRFISYIRLSYQLSVIALQAAMEYRLTFLMQLLGMILNDICWISFWYLFFSKFQNLNGWVYKDTLMLFSVSCASFGIFMGFLGGAFTLARKITNGELDLYMLLPQDPLWHVSFSKLSVSAIGDIAFGIVVGFAATQHRLIDLLIIMLGSTLGAVILYSYTVITQSLAFYFGNFEAAAENLFWQTLTLSFYPKNAFKGPLKFFICTIIPAIPIYFWPADLVKQFSWHLLGLMFCVAVGLFTIARLTFAYGLRRYESGNLMQVRT